MNINLLLRQNSVGVVACLLVMCKNIITIIPNWLL